MMHGHEKSDLAIVAAKSANKAEQLPAERSVAEPTVAEPVERRAGTKGNADQQTMPWAQSQASMPHALERIRQFECRRYPRWEPYAGKPPVWICAGARGNSRPYREVRQPKAGAIQPVKVRSK